MLFARIHTTLPFTLSLLLLCLYGCSTNSASEKTVRKSSPPAVSANTHFPRVTLEHSPLPASDAFRLLGEKAGGGFVLMAGLEERPVPAANWQKQPYGDVVNTYAQELDCLLFPASGYYFIAPEGYESLAAVSLSAALPERYRTLTASLTLGAKTKLYTAFALISQVLGITILSDNFIAESPCGELHLEDLPLGIMLEALLQSARIAPDSMALDASDEYLFIQAKENIQPKDLLLNDRSLPAESSAILDKRLPRFAIPPVSPDNEAALFGAESIPLKDALLPLSTQAGIEIVCRRALADIPINPFVCTDVSLRTALNLLIRQWPLPSFGYEVQDNRILLRERAEP
ncbi:MAG TPA: hypothetical protein PKN92_01025 [Candidatus Hydrogenedentes bacterium]|nr:hypothetical protein [Candidatus Hydrogenedentota bacterium]